ncbi:MAG: amidohydrolase family protein [Armatimonadetes bacterium]|nr:amidohydrolase family protein [Armatimonadota bacterium]
MSDILDINTLFGPYPLANTDLAIDQLLAAMKQHNIGQAVTYSTLGILFDPTVGNAATRAACGDHAELLAGATLNPNRYFGNKASLQSLKSSGFRLVRLFPQAQGWKASSVAFRTLVQDLGETALPLMFHIEEIGEVSELAQALTAYTAPIIFANVEVEQLADLIAVLKAKPNTYVETSSLTGVGAIKAIAESAGAQRLLFGSGTPYQPVTSALKVLEFSGLSGEARTQILGANARRILS